MPNHLVNETSPYLQQHIDNPVDWYSWGDEAFERAKAEDKPIFLSIGYSACHWCHVMAHESFEDEATAAIMNEHFVNIKVDREERPDVDNIYMAAVQALTGRGGWPMSVWLLPDGRPFFGGTYFPNKPRYGIPSFKQVLLRVAEIYRGKRLEIENDAISLTEAISGRLLLDRAESGLPVSGCLSEAVQVLSSNYDRVWGGFGKAPKFPPSMSLELLLATHHQNGQKQALKMVTHTLDRMAWGGIYDQIGGGFHRYSVDERWLVPHFEKMLYDNAQLIGVYLHAYQVTNEERYRKVVEETIGYVKREMTAPLGGFYSSQDADSEGKEGKYFLWDQDEIRHVMGRSVDAECILDYWGMLKGANFDGHSILWVPEPPDRVAKRHNISTGKLSAMVEKAKAILLTEREKRIKPGRDEKVLVAWNGLMIKSLAETARVLDRPDMLMMAANAANFILNTMHNQGRLLRSYRSGKARHLAYLKDYAFFIEGLIELYQSTFKIRWLNEALMLTGQMVELFWDNEAGFYDTASDHESLITRPQEVIDGAIPSGTSGAVAALARMALYTGRSDWLDKADRLIKRSRTAAEKYPNAFMYLLLQAGFILDNPQEVVLIGEPDTPTFEAMHSVIRRHYRPGQITAFQDSTSKEQTLLPILEGRRAVNGKATAYVCQRGECRMPITAPDALLAELQKATQTGSS
ncbi:MAG: thioredoxin domain-containing protein [Anaerolineae bacterium]|nr:thioredoxin domain-containing protein [Anaerolineae bacterium]